YRSTHHCRAHQTAVTTSAISTTAIVTRDVQVCGHRLTAGGNGMSIRPATGPAGTAGASAKGRLHRRVMPAAPLPCRQAAQQATELLRGIFGGAERKHRDG